MGALRTGPQRFRLWLWTGVLIVATAAGSALFLPRNEAYAMYTDGVRPTVVFVWSDPSPGHPHT